VNFEALGLIGSLDDLDGSGDELSSNNPAQFDHRPKLSDGSRAPNHKM
jgi:hypothetical protein